MFFSGRTNVWSIKTSKIMECIVLAGGLGTRLRSLVYNIPKCMAPISSQPFLYFILKYLERQGITHVILSLGYKHEVVENYICENEWNFSFSFSVEDKPLGTGGAIKQALKYSNENNVWIINGDTFFNVDMVNMFNEHLTINADVSIALKKLTNFNRYGILKIDDKNRVISFNEKENCHIGLINGGIYLFNKRCDLFGISDEKFSFETDILKKITSNTYIHGYISNGYFIDIGVPDDYIRVINEIEMLK
jgi:D-glycero-alpha-D-manno-heptose 1-phosphate guanylyltransferase